MSQEEFLLKWNDHHASFFTIVEDLCRTEQLCDVTLACGGQVFETHKLILSVCSPYFRTLLNSRPDKHPIVYLKDVNPKHLEQLLSYMYRGEINVLQDDLGPLIETARGLQIKGLADAGGDGGNSQQKQKSSHNGLPSQPHNQPKRSRTSTPTPAPKMPRIEPGAIARTTPAPIPITRVVSPPGQEEEDHSIVEVDPGENPNVKSEGWMSTGGDGEIADYEIPSEQFEQDMQAEDEQYIQAGNDALSGQQLAMLKKEFQKKYSCEFCHKRFPTPSKLQRHQLFIVARNHTYASFVSKVLPREFILIPTKSTHIPKLCLIILLPSSSPTLKTLLQPLLTSRKSHLWPLLSTESMSSKHKLSFLAIIKYYLVQA